MTRTELMAQLAERALGRPLASTRPLSLSIDTVVAALWPLNKRFASHAAQIDPLAYNAALAPAADAAIERLLLQGDDWTAEPPAVWRVLLERQLQVLTLLALRAGEAGSWSAHFMSVPESADAALQSRLAIAFALHSTPLPFPIVARSAGDLARMPAPGSRTRH